MDGKNGIRVELENHIAVVTLDRPPVNATTRPMMTDLTSIFDSFNNNDAVRVAILTGTGRYFCGGADLKLRSSGLESGQILEPGAQSAHSRIGREAFNSILDCDVPVIGAINGAAVGAGLAIAASCDFLIAAEGAFMALPEINVGLLGGGRHAQRLFGILGARRLMYTADRIGAAELLQRGVVEKVVPAESLMAEARAISERIASKSPVAMKLAKETMNTVEAMSLRDGYRYEQRMTGRLSKSDDAKEAARAFVEKRQADFK